MNRQSARTRKKNNSERERERAALPIFGMEERYNSSKNEQTQSRITFWFYVISIPIIIGLLTMMVLRSGGFQFNFATLACVAIVLYLLFCTYRSFRVMTATKNSHCIVTADRVSGISTPSPYKEGIRFDIARSEILGIAKSTVPVGGMRAYNALVLNTADQKIVLLAIDRIDELRKELQNRTSTEAE